jgi:hypothetical protein
MSLSSRCCERGENECSGGRFLEQRRNFIEWIFTIMTCARGARIAAIAGRAKRSVPTAHNDTVEVVGTALTRLLPTYGSSQR